MGGKSQSTTDPRVNGLQVQTALYGKPIALGWGRARVAGNLIDYDDFASVAHNTSQGGKGGGGPKSTSYTYYATVVIGMALGPITGVRTVYRGGDVFVSGATSACAQAGLTLYTGTLSQTPWPFMAAQHPSKSLAYAGLAYTAASSYLLDSSGGLENHTFEVDFAIQETAVTTGDANPADVISDFLTNSQYGLPLWGAGLVGDLSALRLYCRAQGLFISPLLDSQTQAGQFLQEVMACANADLVWRDGQLQFVPYGDTTVTGNGYTYVPAVAPIYDLSDDDLQPHSDGADPLVVDVSDPSDAYNIVQVEYTNRARQYGVEPVTAQDLANIVQYGARQDQSPKSLHEICDPNVANVVAHLILQRTLYIRNQYKFTLPWSFDRLDPMDIVTLTDSGLGLTRYPVRIVQIDEADNNCADYTAEDLLIGVAQAPLYPVQAANGYQDATAAPGNVSAPLMFNPPTSLVSDLEVWVAVAGVSPAWGGAQVYVSLDGTTYQQVGTITGAARYGVTTADFPVGSDPDTTHTLAVDLTASNGVLTSATNAQADAAASLCWLGGEIVGYSTATLTATSHYNLTGYIRRGQNGTSIVDHPTGTGFARLDSSIFKYSYLPQQVGKTIYVKFASFDVYGAQLQSLASVTAYSILLQPAQPVPSAPTGLALQAPFETTYFTAIWSPVSTATSYTVNVFEHDGVTLLRSVSTYSPTFTYQLADAQTDGDVERTYVVEVIANNGSGSSGPATLTVTNTAPPAITGVAATGTGGSRAFTWGASGVSDLAGYIAVYSSTSGFDPHTAGSVFYTGPNTSATLSGLTVGTAYYVCVAAYDTWSSDPRQLNFSAPYGFTA